MLHLQCVVRNGKGRLIEKLVIGDEEELFEHLVNSVEDGAQVGLNGLFSHCRTSKPFSAS